MPKTNTSTAPAQRLAELEARDHALQTTIEKGRAEQIAVQRERDAFMLIPAPVHDGGWAHGSAKKRGLSAAEREQLPRLNEGWNDRSNAAGTRVSQARREREELRFEIARLRRLVDARSAAESLSDVHATVNAAATRIAEVEAELRKIAEEIAEAKSRSAGVTVLELEERRHLVQLDHGFARRDHARAIVDLRVAEIASVADDEVRTVDALDEAEAALVSAQQARTAASESARRVAVDYKAAIAREAEARKALAAIEATVAG